MLSRAAGVGSGFCGLLAVLYAAGIARSPDSDWTTGLVVCLPLAAVAVGLGMTAFWTRRSGE